MEAEHSSSLGTAKQVKTSLNRLTKGQFTELYKTPTWLHRLTGYRWGQAPTPAKLQHSSNAPSRKAVSQIRSTQAQADKHSKQEAGQHEQGPLKTERVNLISGYQTRPPGNRNERDERIQAAATLIREKVIINDVKQS